jgi:acetaldehyde dehydrogenase (acetylating)
MSKVKVGIIGPGNIGQDLMMKVARSSNLELACVVGVAETPGLERARSLGADTSPNGVDYLVDNYRDEIKIVFDSTSAQAHLQSYKKLNNAGMFTLDLTPAAIGPYCIPTVNLDESMLNRSEVNLVTCAGQATVPMVAAINKVADVYYAEIVSSVSSMSAGPGTRMNIDEFTETTKKALEDIGGADYGKAIIILNPAEPPINMINTIYTRVRKLDMERIAQACDQCLEEMQKFVPGVSFRMKPILKENNSDIVMLIVEIEGSGDYLPKFSGNLDIINAVAVHVAEIKARKILEVSSK